MSRFALVLFLSLCPCLITSPALVSRSLVSPGARAAEIPVEHKPDAKAVQRFGPAYRYPQAGWIVLHIEGDPYPRGYQQGRLLAPEIASYVRTLALDRNSKDPTEGWRTVRTLTDALFLRKFDREFLEEMKGIADGAAAAGAKFGDRAIDLIDIAAANVWQEIDTLDQALAASPTGLEGVKFPKPDSQNFPPTPVPAKKDHCSAFAATGPATADGKIVFGHITMFGLHFGPYVNVWIDCQPTKGRRFVMQAFPGGVWSSQDYYQNDAGILLCETTIDQTPFDHTGEPLTTRARKAIQYAESIDDVVKFLTANNNGLYTNEWLIADTKTNEIAMFELGTKKTKLWRSSKDEWFGGTKGFYWGFNNTKDAQVRLEATPSAGEQRPEKPLWKPSPRDKAWLRFFDKYNGKIDAAAAKVAFGAPPLAAPSSLDAKFTTTALAKDLAAQALYGPPTGRTWSPTADEKVHYPDIRPLVPHPWTVVTINPPPAKVEGKKAADLPEKVPDPLPFSTRVQPVDDPVTEAAWKGTVLPKDDNSYWLIGAVAPYERIVALGKAIEKRDGATAAAERVQLAVFGYRSEWGAARAAEPAWRRAQQNDGILAKPTDGMVLLDLDRWTREQVGCGVVTLHGIRQKLGAAAFDNTMDAFGQLNHRNTATADEFAAAFGRHAGLFRTQKFPDPEATAIFSTRSFRDEPNECLIVYGTKDDEAANRNAARALQELIRKQCLGVLVQVVSDTAATDAELGANHLLLIGGPEVNRVSARCAKGLPAAFASHTCTLKDETYAHPSTCIIAARANPLNPRFSAVVLAGLSAAATNDAPEFLMNPTTPAAEVIVGAAYSRVRPLIVNP
ncbi:MAG TPA: C45 family autoproteolytic acyltransferase/hydrolase [Gemmata sp.]|nr:C45 family autoproteolytic acyltransferase/hydrolase [Gemmata sp.]